MAKAAKRARRAAGKENKDGVAGRAKKRIRESLGTQVGEAAVPLHSAGTLTKKLMEERAREARHIVAHDTVCDVREVLDFARPSSLEDRKAADAVVAKICDALTTGIDNARSEEPAPDNDPIGHWERELAKAAESGDVEALARIAGRWKHIADEPRRAPAGCREAALAPPFMALVLLVAHYLTGGGGAGQSGRMQTRAMKAAVRRASRAKRLLLPFADTDIKPDGADENQRMCILLRLCALDDAVRLQGETSIHSVFAGVELKFDPRERVDVLTQVVEYAQQIYAKQCGRRYVWGVTVCCAEVRACVLLHDAVLVSPAMDFAQATGREQLVRLLVDMSVCDVAQLGLDPTIRHIPGSASVLVDCFDDSSSSSRPWAQYRLTKWLFSDAGAMGRHTRCFLAQRADGGDDAEEVVIKDSWVVVDQSDGAGPRNEVELLRHITNAHKGKQVDYLFPRLIAGGEVHLKGPGGAWVADTIDAILGLVGATRVDPLSNSGTVTDGWVAGGGRSWARMPNRAHRRIVMSPVGSSIDNVGKEPSLIVVLEEAMRCHDGIFWECGILHGDISENNILAVSDMAGGPPRGLLIDLDYAVQMDQVDVGAQPERVGTLPYMSIGNIAGTRAARTRLDDWESLLYLVCWLGTTGLTQEECVAARKRADSKKAKRLPIYDWTEGTPDEIAESKPPAPVLAETDPLVERARHEEAIVRELLGVMAWMAGLIKRGMGW
ncbi:hypothetical protein H4R18_003068 [Coemansia javaensis]|uniref:Fungal-type protein kinase domain-containing protein n=1 Tax=Coemansia javaensis TaxID=2761396 RepID=A0A9W8H824_9FUNG|nr:hypothetical protein H4R18_003068 [Coemansia javaensis]